MPVAWRIVKARHAASVLDGEGARRYGGRWNSPGVPVVYASDSRALAALEVLAGLGRSAVLAHFLLIPLEFEEKLVATVDPSHLPEDWQESPPPTSTQGMGDVWIHSKETPVLRVPSVIIPREFNFLLDPRHWDFPEIRVGEPEPLRLDPRLA